MKCTSAGSPTIAIDTEMQHACPIGMETRVILGGEGALKIYSSTGQGYYRQKAKFLTKYGERDTWYVKPYGEICIRKVAPCTWHISGDIKDPAEA